MKERRFALRPFPSGGPLPGVEITGKIGRQGDLLTVSYLLQGRLGEVAMPAPQSAPARRDRLWEETCFEFFLAAAGSPAYWEFNLSPAGAWNVYHFTAYRQGMAPEAAWLELPFEVQTGPDSVRLRVAVHLAGLVPADQGLEVAIAAVLRLHQGETTYWALTHPGPQADFHRRDSFLLTL